MDPNNPFLALFTSNTPPSATLTSNNQSSESAENLLSVKINNLIENVFLITLNRSGRKNKQLIYMEDVASGTKDQLLTLEVLEQALFDRVILFNPTDYLIPNNETTTETANVAETKAIIYLFGSYLRNEKHANPSDTIITENYTKMKSLILRNVATSLKQPDLYEGQNLSNQILDIFKLDDEDLEIKARFLSDMVQEMLSDSEEFEDNKISLSNIFNPIFTEVHKVIRGCSLISIEKWVIPFLQVFVNDKSNLNLAELILNYTTPPLPSLGVKYSESLFGQLLCLSILPKNDSGPYEYFEKMATTNLAEYNSLSSSLWNYTKNHLEMLHTFFKAFLLMGGNIRSKMLSWIGDALHANMPRGQIWNTHQMQGITSNPTVAPDAFMVSLAGVLLRLCQPLLKPQLKVLIVDPTYSAIPDGDKRVKGIHMKETEKETCLLPIDENEYRLAADKYNFVSECFFMTHKAIDLGFRVCIEKIFRMSRELHQIQAAYQDGIAQGAEVAGNIMQMLQMKTQMFLCYQNALLEPTTDAILLSFYEASAIWLNQLASREMEEIDNLPTAKGFAPQITKDVKLPLSNQISKVLKCIPEYIIENIVGYLLFTRHFESQNIRVDVEAQNSIFTMILIFMGSSKRVKNPHLRAKLAEGLESLLPKRTDSPMSSFQFNQALFSVHPHRLEIIPNLLRVFVSIEMTGQSVQFEQKFNYRRPMYVIMDYLWNLDEQKKCFKDLEREAIINMDAEDPPIFLRFINLLINDAIFLLDESLNNLQQIRQLQAAQDNGEWTDLPQNERQQNIANLRHLGMMAKFDNILGRDTINIIKLLTSNTKDIFSHSSMVDRVAAMLNYFLLNLTGPKKENFKVKDKKEYEFDPANTVLEICRIYVNLMECNTFCLAVSGDGRSYSPKLFEYAEQVLVRIGGGQLIGEIQEFSIKVQRLERQQKIDEEVLVDAPEEFMDPIMSTLMIDPVILPSSKITVDRSTIARHLLSDQSDPFNRSPLTMDQVKRNTELKDKIDSWIKGRREAHAANSGSTSTSST